MESGGDIKQITNFYQKSKQKTNELEAEFQKKL